MILIFDMYIILYQIFREKDLLYSKLHTAFSYCLAWSGVMPWHVCKKPRQYPIPIVHLKIPNTPIILGIVSKHLS